MNKTIICGALTVSCAFGLLPARCAPPPASSLSPATLEQLRSDKEKRLAKRDARFNDLLAKAAAKLADMQSRNPALHKRMKEELDQIVMTGPSISEPRMRADIELLEAFVKEHSAPSAEELGPLQERYGKICSQLDDLALVKDLDRAFKVHDKLVKYTSLGLWSAEKISSQLERLEELLNNAPDISYGSSELLETYKNKKLAAVPKLLYLGTNTGEEMFLTNAERRSEALIESTGGSVAIETADHLIQSTDGKRVDVTDSSPASRAMPFSPPLSLWAKTRILLGRVPAISFRLPDRTANSALTVSDVIDGKLDDYIRKNMIALGSSKVPVVVGFLTDFDRDAAAWSFGEDGKTPYYAIMDAKLKDMPAEKLDEELKKRIDKGVFSGAKSMPPELSNKYGDPAIPDGPERVRDSLKRFKSILGESGGPTLAFYSTVGAFHGNKNAARLNQPAAGNQIWNKLEYYWPGDGVLDWIGINAIGTDPVTDAKGPNLMESIEPFMSSVRTTNWQSTPVMLRGLAPSSGKAPLSEAPWIVTVFGQIIPATFPNISLVFLNIPENITLWNGEAISAFRTNVSSNKFYKWPLRFKNTAAPSKDQQAISP